MIKKKRSLTILGMVLLSGCASAPQSKWQTFPETHEGQRQELAYLEQMISESKTHIAQMPPPKEKVAQEEPADEIVAKKDEEPLQMSPAALRPEADYAMGGASRSSSSDQEEIDTRPLATRSPWWGEDHCPDPCKHTRAICHAARRICDISKRLQDESSKQKCQDAEKECNQAKDLTQAKCTGECAI